MRSCAQSFSSLNDASCFNWIPRFYFLCTDSLNGIFTNSPVDLEQEVDRNTHNFSYSDSFFREILRS